MRIKLGDTMKYEVLLNEKDKVWVFHDRVLPARIAWVEFDPAAGTLDIVPHDMRAGILYTEIPQALHARVRAAHLVYFYLTDGDRVMGFQKVPLHVKKPL